MKLTQANTPIRIMLVDDDVDDHFFFDSALNALPFNTELTALWDGSELLTYLLENYEKLPEVVFIDHNMPLVNGVQCISEIKLRPRLKDIPIILYSTNLQESLADLLYAKGVYYYVCKAEIPKLKSLLSTVLTLITKEEFRQPKREDFELKCS